MMVMASKPDPKSSIEVGSGATSNEPLSKVAVVGPDAVGRYPVPVRSIMNLAIPRVPNVG